MIHRIGWSMRTTRRAIGSNSDTRYVNTYSATRAKARVLASMNAKDLSDARHSPSVQNIMAAYVIDPLLHRP